MIDLEPQRTGHTLGPGTADTGARRAEFYADAPAPSAANPSRGEPRPGEPGLRYAAAAVSGTDRRRLLGGESLAG